MKVRRLLCSRYIRGRLIIYLLLACLLLLFFHLRQVTNVSNYKIIPKAVFENNDVPAIADKQFIPENKKKIDWHDHEKIKMDEERRGPGEQGVAAVVPPRYESSVKKLYSENGFNGALSDIISLNRSLPDLRHPGCRTKTYIASLPSVSVVVPVHNEHWSSLLRTVYSVLNRSPEKLLKEIILVDDASTKEFLKEELDVYVHRYLPKVKIIRLPERRGLITARLEGAKRAKGDVLVFLDSHTEATHNWLPPLLEPIALNYRTATCPFIDVIAYDTFEFRAQDNGARGAFDWELFYKRLPLMPKDKQNMPEPFESPVMAGGLFAISRFYFWQLGGYDPGLDIWGGEQYEISFKIWQCGGRMLDIPCSRVGHIYRDSAPFPNPGHGDFVGKNYRRVAEVWMDEYARHLYARRPHYLKIDPGDLTVQKELRKNLKCKSFKWFMTQVAFDLIAKYPPVEPEPYAIGQIRPASNKQLCVDVEQDHQKKYLTLNPCHRSPVSRQISIMSWHKDIKFKINNMCWDLPESQPKSQILLYQCHLGGGNQEWRYYPDVLKIVQVDSGKCADCDLEKNTVFINNCLPDVVTQKWVIDKVNKEMFDKWNDEKERITGPVEHVEE